MGCCVTFFQLGHWDGRFKYSAVCLHRLVSSLSQVEYFCHDHNFRIITIWSMVYARCTHIDLGEQPNTIVRWWLDDVFWLSLQFALGFYGALSPYYPVEIDYFSIGLIFLTYCMIFWVCIISMIWYFSPSVVLICLDVFKTVLGSFKSLTRKIWFQGSVILVECTASSYCWAPCTDPSILSASPWYLIPRQNHPLLPWVFS